MYYPLNPPLLELLLLSVISKSDTYGYQIGQDLKSISDLKDSTLYPILKKLSDSEYVQIYDQQFNGRNRKYYHITEEGKKHLDMLRNEWKEYVDTISELLDNCEKETNEQAVKETPEQKSNEEGEKNE